MGNATEALVGIVENNRDEADHPVFGEMKNKIDGTTSRLTLFTRNPKYNMMISKGRRGAIRSLTEAYGLAVEDDTKTDRRNLYQTLKFGTPTYVGGSRFDLVIENTPDPRLTIHVDHRPVAAWDTPTIDAAFNKKLPKLTMTKGQSVPLEKTHPSYELMACDGEPRVARWTSITQYEKPDLDGFWNALRNGKVVIDLRAYIHTTDAGKIKSRDHGTAFRIAEEHIPLIFKETNQIII